MGELAISKELPGQSSLVVGTSTIAQRKNYGQTTFQSYEDEQFPIPPEDASQRLSYLWNKFLRTKLHVGGLTCTVQDYFTNSEIRRIVSKKMLKRVYKQIRNIARNILQSYDDVTNNPKVKATLKFREDHLNLKVTNFVIKIFRQTLKLLIQLISADELRLEDFEQSIKNVGSLTRFAAKVINFKDMTFEDLRKGALKAALKCFKIFYNIIKIPVNAIEIANKNPILLLAYEAAGLGTTYQPFSGIAVEFVAIVSTPLACLKLIGKTGILIVAWYELYQVNEDDSSYAEKQFNRNKALISWSTEICKFAVKMTVISATGIVALWLIPVGSATAAAMGLWQYYKSMNATTTPVNAPPAAIADTIDDQSDPRPDFALSQSRISQEA